MSEEVNKVRTKRKRRSGASKSNEEPVSSEHSAKRIKISPTKEERGVGINGLGSEIAVDGGHPAEQDLESLPLTAPKGSETPAKSGVSEPQPQKRSRPRKRNKSKAAEAENEEIEGTAQPNHQDTTPVEAPTTGTVDARTDGGIGDNATTEPETHEEGESSKKRRKRKRGKAKETGVNADAEVGALDSKSEEAEPSDTTVAAVTTAEAPSEGDGPEKQRKPRHRWARHEKNKTFEPLEAGEPQAASNEVNVASKQLPKKPVATDIMLGKHKVKHAKQAKLPSTAWVVSNPVGGRFLHTDPVFTQDEKYLIIANDRSLLVYSISTSLLMRKLPITSASSGCISGFALSKTNPNNLYVGTSSGLIVHWDWLGGRELGRWETEIRIHGLAICTSHGSSYDAVYTLGTTQIPDRGTRRVVTAHNLMSGSEAAETKHVTIFETRTVLRSFQVLLGGNTIVAASRGALIIGNLDKPGDTFTNEPRYTWRDLKCTEPITCFDAMAGTRDSNKKPKKPQQKAPSSDQTLNVVIGGAKGMIFVYEDLLNSLVQSERASKTSEPTADLKPRILHWHRQAVGTVRWSLDGNYILSGGAETVLLLWQLDTGRRQELPHLTSAIDNLVVSPTGASYAVQLADNSVMVLSTSELKPKANIPGIQAQAWSSGDHSKPQKNTKKFPDLDDASDLHAATAAAISPLQPNQILLAVPSLQSKDDQTCHLPAPYLQTYDISSSRHVSRQAMTRNNATIFNVGPEATKLQEPDVQLMRVSHDGQWLATVEEWVPPVSDVGFLAIDEGIALEEQTLRREVYLKFWSWDKQKQLWALEMRIDAPHSFCDGLIPGRVFDLVAEPRDVGFATVGEDGFVRVWKPKTRLHDGTVVRGSHGEGLVTWTCRYTVELENSAAALDAEADFPAAALPMNACLAYSADGSVLVASQEYAAGSNSGSVHFIDAAAGEIRYSKPGLYSAGLAALAFVDRYLVILSDSLNVWDIVTEELVYSLDLNTSERITRAKHLAVNTHDNTFAVALPKSADHKHASPRQSRVIIFDPSVSEPLYKTTLPHVVTALLPAQAAKGYIALDSAAEIRILSPKAAPAISLLAPEQALAALNATPAMDVVEAEEEDAEAGQDVDMDLDLGLPDEIDDDDKPVVRPEQLAQIFDVGPSFALPPVREMFGAVVGLYARKPRAMAVGDVVASA